MSPRTGRPTEEPRSHRESFRMSDKDMEKITFICEKLGISKTEAVKRGVDKVYQELKK